MPVTIYPTNLKYKNSNGQFQSATAIKGDSGAAITVQVEGSAPTIVCEDNHRYVCGEVLSLNITLPDNGIVDVVFESGSTPTVLTITPPTGVTDVVWVDEFDPSNLSSNATYLLKFIDGKYGVATAWGVQSGGSKVITLREWSQLGEDIDSIEIPLPSRYTKIVVRLHGRMNNQANDIADTSKQVVLWLGDDTNFNSAAQDRCVYTSMYIRQSNKFMLRCWFDVNYPYLERFATDSFGATIWSASQTVKAFGGSYDKDITKLSSYPSKLLIRPYETNQGYLIKSDSYLEVYAVI